MRWSVFAAVMVAVPALAEEPDYPARLDALQRTRDDAATRKQIDDLLSEALKTRGNDYEVVWRAARYWVWEAEIANNESRAKIAAKRGWDLGEKAMALKPDRVEGAFYAAAGVGLHGKAGGIMRAISDGVQTKFNERLDKAIKLDPTFAAGAVWLARARYDYEVPFFMRDLKESADLCRKASAKFPENLRAHLYLADTLLKDGDAKGAKVEIDKVLAGDESYDPPEARRVKMLARESAKAIKDAL